MDFEKSESRPNAWNRANFLSRIVFWWITPLFFKGWNGDLKLSDIDDCPDVDSSQKMAEIIEKEWDKELEKQKLGKNPSLLRAIIRIFGLRFCFITILAFVANISRLIHAVVLGYMIRRIQQLPDKSQDFYVFAAVVCTLGASFGIAFQNFAFDALHLGIKIKIGCCLLMYKKALKLSQSALTTTSVGQMVNLFSNDVNKFNTVCRFLPFLIIAPIQIVISIYILWMYIGYSCVVGMSLLLFYMPLQMQMGNAFSKLRMKAALLADERICLMREVIGGMRLIKMYGWEVPFAKLVKSVRRKELQQIRRTAFLRAINMAVFATSHKVMLLVAIAVFAICMSGDLTPEKVFACLLIYNTQRHIVNNHFAQAISVGSEALMSLRRIQNFLLLEEQSDALFLEESTHKQESNICKIVMKEVNTSWKSEGVQTLRNVTFTLNAGDFLAVVGPVGCGKSTLLLSILGELPTLSGEMTVKGRMAYASQNPWIFGGSVQQNILFGNKFDEKKYRRVLDVCALNKDIKLLPYGDNTVVGDRGVKLSGGQKARVGLARAVYSDADIFLLDDPLSAVDLSVAKHLFDECINGYLKDKVRILATHQIQFLKSASQVLVLKDGMCQRLGTYKKLVDAGVDLGIFAEDKEVGNQNPSAVERLAENISIPEEKANDTTQNSTNQAPGPSKEVKMSGSVQSTVYRDYIKSGVGPFFAIAIFFTFVLSATVLHGGDFWLMQWTSQEQLKVRIRDCWGNMTKAFLNESGYYDGANSLITLKEVLPTPNDSCWKVTQNFSLNAQNVEDNIDIQFQLSVYCGFILILLLLCFVRTTSFYQMCMKASIALHNKMLQKLLRSPIAFFDSNPVGVILNRVSQDLGIIDDCIPQTSADALEALFVVIGTVCVAIIIEPYMIIPTLFLGIVLVYLRRFFLRTARDVKRYEAITRSPVLSLLSTSVDGLTTIRAFRVQKKFETCFYNHQDQLTATSFAFLSVTQWFAIMVESLCGLFNIILTLAMVGIAKDSSFASRVGLALASAVQIFQCFQVGLRSSAEVESQMTAVERVLEYTNLKTEAPLESDPEKQPPETWPSHGHIVYRDVSLKYSLNEEPVLKKISFEIHSAEKIGIVGRTGAGKSSIIATLLRMTEPTGTILIDDINIQDIGLHDLRKKITIIPQDPVLYTGSVKRNLDPFDNHTDEELWQALEEVFLKEPIQALNGGLHAMLSDGGRNFSVGQRQLICLARAILLKNRIIVLDEATANVDLNTDSLIQLAIRNRFGHCTVLTIAHRLQTVMDSDRVMVLDFGNLKEFDEPHNLLQNPNSHLSQMLQLMEPGMANELRETAYAAHQKNSGRKEAMIGCRGFTVDESREPDASAHEACRNEDDMNGYINIAFNNSEKAHGYGSF